MWLAEPLRMSSILDWSRSAQNSTFWLNEFWLVRHAWTHKVDFNGGKVHRTGRHWQIRGSITVCEIWYIPNRTDASAPRSTEVREVAGQLAHKPNTGQPNRGLVNSRTGQFADGLDNSWTMHWTTRRLVRVPIFSISTLSLHWQLSDQSSLYTVGNSYTNVYGTAHILFIYYSVFSCPFVWPTSFI